MVDTLVIPAQDVREGHRLSKLIADKTGEFADVRLVYEDWHITTNASEKEVRSIVESHDGTPEPVSDPDNELRTAIENASNLNELKAALLGTSANARAAVAGRPN